MMILGMMNAMSAHADSLVTCISKTRGDRLSTDAKITYKANRESHISRMEYIKGYIKIGFPNISNLDLAVHGFFNIDALAANPLYKPNKYKNAEQFQHFDANTTIGIENGMWGNFIVEDHLDDQGVFKAHYIFQAGENTGATVHFTCKAKEII